MSMKYEDFKKQAISAVREEMKADLEARINM